MSDPRWAAAPAVGALAEALDGVAVGLYVGGSLATGDYRAGISDIDAVALVDHRPSRLERERIRRTHRLLVATVDGAESLHCVYVPRASAETIELEHWTWAFGELFRRRLGGIARAELLADPLVLFGPAPASWLPPMDRAAIGEAAQDEIAGYWIRAVRRRSLWQQDVYVDLGLTVWARAEAAIEDGLLITKREAIDRLREQDLPSSVVEGVAARRAGESSPLTPAQRDARAVVVRAFLATRLARLAARR